MPSTMTHYQNQQACLNRITFQCKRGNLETELLLIAYVEKCIKPIFDQQPLPSEKIALFEALLNESDQALFNWLLPHSLETENHPTPPTPAQFRTLLRDTPNHYLNSSR